MMTSTFENISDINVCLGLAQASYPTAETNGHTYPHRKVLVRSHRWMVCEDERKLVADHLDDKLNNERTNLTASCPRYNATHGLFTSWFPKHQGDPFLLNLFQRGQI